MSDADDLAADAAGPGAMLARGREAKRLSVDEVAARLKFAPRQIEALEADDYARLPGNTFVRGMIRGYARLLGADAAPMLQAYERQHVQPAVVVEASDPRTQPRIPFPDGRTKSTRVYGALIAVILTVTGAVVYESRFGLPSVLQQRATEPAKDATHVASAPQSPQSDAPAPQAAAAPQPAPAPPVAPAAPAQAAVAVESGENRLVFEFGDESWVEVKDRSGKTLLSQLNPGGSRQTVEGRPPFSLVIGNASQVRLRYNDAPVDLKPHIKVDVARMTLK